MMLSLNSVKKMINTNFILFSEKQSETEMMNKVKSLTSEKIFIQENTDTFLFVRYIKSLQQIEYQPCETLNINAPLNEVLTKISEEPLIICDQNQKMIGFCNAKDISLFIHENYQRLQAFVSTILQTTDESFTIVDKEKHVLGWTKGAENLFSVKQEDIIGKPITDFFNENQLELLNTLKGTSVHHQQHKARDNQVVLINSNPVYLNSEIIGAVVSETDITDQIKLYNELYNTTEKLFNLEKEVTKLTANDNPFQFIHGSSPNLNKTINKVKKAAMTDASILIQGESGVGKELFAKAAHHLREDEHAPFIAINCGAIPESLFESEMFGYEKGAFSGANQKGKKGKVELAKNGTLFLDEIGEMPLDMQVKLLRLLQEKKFYPVGGTKEVEIDFRVIAATNKDLVKLVEEKKFRDDLFYRLNVVSIDIPPLRDRPADIIELAHLFLSEISVKYNRTINRVSQPVMQALLQHDWPGNIRELQNVMERLVVFSDEDEVKVEDIPFDVNTTNNAPIEEESHLDHTNNDLSLNERLLSVERTILQQELDKANGNKQLCAKNLNITRATLYNRLKKVDLDI